MNTPHASALPRIAVPAEGVAQLLDVSERHVWALHASGRLPRPVRLGRAVRWSADELRDWLAAGAPSRDAWEQAKEASR
ncbi:MAG: helix-turn-helix domain-containing protein [Planctomycetaceae bacterium]|jgi:predicted DNA-binding transcriptional regulator AlpA|nr:helix-turn-helix domain-containing protein [Planctomycetaceae bacterium]